MDEKCPNMTLQLKMSTLVTLLPVSVIKNPRAMHGPYPNFQPRLMAAKMSGGRPNDAVMKSEKTKLISMQLNGVCN